MSDQSELQKAIEVLNIAYEEKDKLVKEAAEKIETVRQVQTESPNR